MLRLRAPGQGLVDAGQRIARHTFDAAADNADDVPLVGCPLRGHVAHRSAGGARLGEAGRWQIEAVESPAFRGGGHVLELDGGTGRQHQDMP
ncbi:hypothetical protein [Alloactinosynnema sp. L-07]|nr:hypothetical protein [Alloactinosynnema sp. L-07]